MGEIDKSVIDALNDNYKPKLTVSQAIKKIKDLDKKAKSKNETFLLTYKNARRNAVTEKNTAVAYAKGKQLVIVSGKNFYIKKEYLKGLKDPVKYIEGLYVRGLRNAQKNAYKNKDYNGVVNLAKKLNKLKKENGVSDYKLKKSKNIISSNIEKLFGIKLDKKSKQKLTRTSFKDRNEFGAEIEIEEEDYTPIVSYTNGVIQISYI